jgi:hypothetical protein
MLALAGIGLVMAQAAPAMADNFGAIAFSSSSGANGYSYDHGSREGAEEHAMQECGPGCEVVLWFKNACGSLAVGNGNGYGTGWADSRGEAEDIAMRSCRQQNGGCGVKVWTCTTR